MDERATAKGTLVRRLAAGCGLVFVLLIAGGALAGWLADRHLTRVYVHQLAADGDTEGLTVLLRFFPAKVNARDKDERTPLLHAVKGGHAATVRNLLAAGANPNALFPDDDTVLHMAIAAGDSDVVELLLDAEADVSLTDRDGRSPLVLAAQLEHHAIAYMLLAAGAELDQPVAGQPPLHHLVTKGSLGGVTLLLKLGMDVNGKDNAGRTALDLALTAEQQQMIDLLRSRDALTASDLDRTVRLEVVYQNWLKTRGPTNADEAEAIVAELGHVDGRRRKAAMQVANALQIPALEMLLPKLQQSDDPEIRLAAKEVAASLATTRAGRITVLTDKSRELERQRKYPEAAAAYLELATMTGKKEHYDRRLRLLARDRKNPDAYHKAITAYLKIFPEEHKRYASTLFRRALRSKDYPKATKLAQDIYKAQPSSRTGRLVWDALIGAGKHEEAAAHYLAMADNPKIGSEAYRQSLQIAAANVLAEKHPAKAAALLAGILRTPKLSDDMKRRAIGPLVNHLQKTKSLDAYMKTAIQGAQAKPKDLARTGLVADLYDAQKATPEIYRIRADWRVKAYRLKPTDETLFWKASMALRNSRQHKLLVDLLKDYYKRNPEREGESIQHFILVLHKVKEYDLIFGWIEAYRKHESSKKGTHPDVLLAQQYHRMKQYGKAALLCEKMLDGTSLAYAQDAADQLGIIYRQQKKWAKAIAALEKGAKLKKIHPHRAWRMLATIADIHLEQDESDKAMAIYQRALNDKALSWARLDVVTRIHDLYLKQEQPHKALALLESQKGQLTRSHEKRRLAAMIAKLDGKRKEIKKAKLTEGIKKRFKGHEDVVRCVAFMPGGKRIISGGNDSTLRAWDPDSGKQLFSVKAHKGAVCSIAITATVIISGGDDGEIKLWNTNTGKSLGRLGKHQKGVWALALSSDRKLLASAGLDGKAKLWNLKTKKLVREFSGHSRGVRGIAISPKGDRLLTGGMDRQLILWDLKTGKQISRFRAHKFAVRTVAFSTDGATVFSGSDDMTIGVWDAATGKSVKRLKGHASVVTGLCLMPGGKRLLSTGLDSVLTVWDLASGKPVHKLENHTGGISGVALSADGKRVLTAGRDNTICLLTIPTK